jgi:uncharacterized protein YndB with AHSA1/START domain
MAVIRVEATREIAGDPARVFACIADYREQRPAWLPPNYSAWKIEKGGTGAGTEVRYHLKVGPRERDYQMRVTEPQPGAVLSEADATSSMVNTWTVTPRGTGSVVSIVSQWNGASGVGGFFERLFAPRTLKQTYDQLLGRLDRYVRDGRATAG